MFRANQSVCHPLQEPKFPCSSWNDAETNNIVLLDRSWNTTIFLAFLSGLSASSRQLESWQAKNSTVIPVLLWVGFDCSFAKLWFKLRSNTDKHSPHSRSFKEMKTHFAVIFVKIWPWEVMPWWTLIINHVAFHASFVWLYFSTSVKYFVCCLIVFCQSSWKAREHHHYILVSRNRDCFVPSWPTASCL